MNMFLFIIGVLVLVLGLFPLFFALKLRKFVKRALAQSTEKDLYQPKVTVILPCKGLDPGFNLNIQAFLDQDYPDFNLVFITATKEDPAYEVLQRICAVHKEDDTSILVAGINGERSQKLSNLLKGVAEAATDTEVFAFVDSDTRPHKGFLRYLIDPLKSKEVGATTGFRWYLPEKRNFASVLRSTWNGGGLPFLVDQKNNYAWGGAMAVSKSTFERAEIARAWESAVSDDFPLTHRVKGLGLQIRFVPQCLVVSHEDATLLETLEWTNRQQTIARVYAPGFWWSVTWTHSLANLILIAAFVIIACSIIRGLSIPSGALIMLLLIPLEMLDVFILIPTVIRLIPRHTDTLCEMKWYYACLAPAASLLSVINAFRSMISRRITWRGITYEMRSPEKTVIIGKNNR
ncbi:MAG: glycosyltransferase family 2 protein [Planctomycetes bacterium]|nr:glycosyltransferase family 2 protein [Planctomycetota bacterium]